MIWYDMIYFFIIQDTTIVSSISYTYHTSSLCENICNNVNLSDFGLFQTHFLLAVLDLLLPGTSTTTPSGGVKLHFGNVPRSYCISSNGKFPRGLGG